MTDMFMKTKYEILFVTLDILTLAVTLTLDIDNCVRKYSWFPMFNVYYDQNLASLVLHFTCELPHKVAKDDLHRTDGIRNETDMGS